MQMSTYLIFNGDCAEAFSFYERVLGGRIVMMHRDMETSTSGSGARHRLMHARLELGEFSLMGSDAPPGDERAAGRQVYVAVSVAAGEAERILRALSDGGRITMPLKIPSGRQVSAWWWTGSARHGW